MERMCSFSLFLSWWNNLEKHSLQLIQVKEKKSVKTSFCQSRWVAMLLFTVLTKWLYKYLDYPRMGGLTKRNRMLNT